MKIKMLLVFIVLCRQYNNLYSQRYDQVWRLGASYFDIDSVKSGGILLDFTLNKPIQSVFKNDIQTVSGQATMCDSSGIPSFYSNGCEIWNFNHQILVNGDKLGDIDPANYSVCIDGFYVENDRGMIALPNPGDINRYDLFHLVFGPLSYLNCSRLLHTSIDMSIENGRGGVTEKNELILEVELDGITAVRHGNGRDWWLYCSALKAENAPIYLFLLDPAGLHGPVISTELGTWPTDPLEFGLQPSGSVFSPDGSKFARVIQYHGIQFANFDRCTGAFSCPIDIPFPQKPGNPSPIDFELDNTYVSGVGISFSPNSRFVYVSTGERLYQFDTWKKDIAASRVLVGNFENGYLCPYFVVSLYQQQLAPDGKIYMSATNGVSCLSVINEPDKKGVDCNFVPHQLELLRINGFGLPIYPNFRLYDWENSPCDTIITTSQNGKTESIYSEKLKVVPNPVSDMAKIVIPPGCGGLSLKVFDTTGKLVVDYGEVYAGQTVYMDVSFLSSAPYLVALFSGKQVVASAKMIVMLK